MRTEADEWSKIISNKVQKEETAEQAFNSRRHQVKSEYIKDLASQVASD
jgi:hypothetical protein